MPAAAAPPVSRPASRVDPNAVLALVAVAQFMVPFRYPELDVRRHALSTTLSSFATWVRGGPCMT